MMWILFQNGTRSECRVTFDKLWFLLLMLLCYSGIQSVIRMLEGNSYIVVLVKKDTVKEYFNK